MSPVVQQKQRNREPELCTYLLKCHECTYELGPLCAYNTVVFIIIIIIIILLLRISFMQSIYTYIPEKTHVPREHCVAAILM